MTTMPVTIFLCGDVMTGRGIDQILPHPVDPILYEPSIRDARAYVRLAEQQAGRIAAPGAFEYIWGEALEELERVRPAARLIISRRASPPAGTPGRAGGATIGGPRRLSGASRAAASIAAPWRPATPWTGATRAASRRSGRWREPGSRRWAAGRAPGRRRSRSRWTLARGAVSWSSPTARRPVACPPRGGAPPGGPAATSPLNLPARACRGPAPPAGA